MNNRTTDFDVALRKAGIPIDGVSGDGPACRIDYTSAATAQHRTAGDAMRLTFDWRKRRVKSRQAIFDAINGLPAPQKMDLLIKDLAERARQDPTLFKRLGENIDADEPEVP